MAGKDYRNASFFGRNHVTSDSYWTTLGKDISMVKVFLWCLWLWCPVATVILLSWQGTLKLTIESVSNLQRAPGVLNEKPPDTLLFSESVATSNKKEVKDSQSTKARKGDDKVVSNWKKLRESSRHSAILQDDEKKILDHTGDLLQKRVIPPPIINCTTVQALAQDAKLYSEDYRYFGDGQKKRRTDQPHTWNDISEVESWTRDQFRRWNGSRVNIFRYTEVRDIDMVVRVMWEGILTDSHIRIFKYCEDEDVFVDEYLGGSSLSPFRICSTTPNFLQRLKLLISVVQSIVDLNKQGVCYGDFKWTQWRQIAPNNSTSFSRFKLVDVEVIWLKEWKWFNDVRRVYTPMPASIRENNCPTNSVEWCSPYRLLDQSHIPAPRNMNCTQQYKFVWELIEKKQLPFKNQKSPFKAFQLQSLMFIVELFLVPESKMTPFLYEKYRKMKCTWGIPPVVKDDLDYLLDNGCDLVNGYSTLDLLERLEKMENILST